MFRTILFFIFHFSFFTIQGQDVSFYKENITMKIEQDYFYVTGNYFLKTTGDQLITLIYPLPVDSLYGEVDTISIYNLTTNKPVQILDREKDVVVFKLEFGEYKEVELLISYRQKLLGNRAEYILESTASWRKPLERADYQLIVPAGMEIESFSIKPDESVIAGEEMIYYWTKKNFMPAVNIIIQFKNE
jgi:hypothetical protein